MNPGPRAQRSSGLATRPQGQAGNESQRVDFLGRRDISTSGFAATATAMAVFALFLLVQPGNQYQMVQIDFLAANHVHIIGLCGQN